jgi:hypothetical protein
MLDLKIKTYHSSFLILKRDVEQSKNESRALRGLCLALLTTSAVRVTNINSSLRLGVDDVDTNLTPSLVVSASIPLQQFPIMHGSHQRKWSDS